jgi:exonuclease-1
MDRIRMLQHFNVTPFVVLDGGPLPMKRSEELERQQYGIIPFSQSIYCFFRRRKERKEMADAYLQQGNKKKAYECYQQSVDITPTMALQFIKVRLMYTHDV